jgi:cold-inducible RNA-binding protein
MSNSKLHIGNLSWNTTDDSLRLEFAKFGKVADAIVMRDRDSGRSRGFGFVTFEARTEAEAAVEGLNDQEQVSFNCSLYSG